MFIQTKILYFTLFQPADISSSTQRWSFCDVWRALMSALELSVLCVINRAAAGIVPFTLTHSAALHQTNCVSLFWNIHKCAMAEAASAESDDKPRWEVMTCYICLLASAAQPSADSMLPREALIIICAHKREIHVSRSYLALIMYHLLKLPATFHKQWRCRKGPVKEKGRIFLSFFSKWSCWKVRKDVTRFRFLCYVSRG